MDAWCRERGFAKDRASRNNEVVNVSWRLVTADRVLSVWVNTWDPWDAVQLQLADGDVAALEDFWASRVPMTAQEMTPGDLEYAIERGAKGTWQNVEIDGMPALWPEKATAALEAALGSASR